MTETITSGGNTTLKLIRRLGRDASARRESGLMLCDGVKLLEEALNSGLTPVHVVTSGGTDTDLPPLPQGVRLIETPKSLFEGLSALGTPQKVLFTVPIPDTSPKPLKDGECHIVLDRVQDPGNVGSVLRTACAFAIDTVILTPGCAELSNPKTLRASMGTAFRQRVMRGDQQEIWEMISGSKVYATGLSADALPLADVRLENCTVIIGNEGRGLSEFWLSKKGLPVLTIPMPGGCESLGAAVAAALVMWEMKR